MKNENREPIFFFKNLVGARGGEMARVVIGCGGANAACVIIDIHLVFFACFA